MKSIRIVSPLAILLAATALSIPAAAEPASGPGRYFSGSDLFNLEVATDPQISPDGRTIAYVRRSNDIMVKDAELLHAVGWRLANSHDWPNWSSDSEFRAARDASAAERGEAAPKKGERG